MKSMESKKSLQKAYKAEKKASVAAKNEYESLPL